MTTKPTRAERRQARTESIIDAALEILLEEGVQAITMRRLASDLSLTPGAMYRYFDGKDAILVGMGQRTLGRYTRELQRREQEAREEAVGLSEEATALYVLLARTWHYFTLSMDDPAGWRLVNLFMVTPKRLIDGEQGSRLFALMTAQLQRVAALTTEAVGVGALSPGAGLDRALVLFATLNGHLQLMKVSTTSGLGFSTAHTLRLSLQSLLTGWGAPPSVLQAALQRLDARSTKLG